MASQRTILVGDIHGCLEEFDELLRVLEFVPRKDRLVLLGDLVDRGPDPVGVVRRARELRAESVLGNHEEKHLRYRRHEKKVATVPGYKNPMKPFTDERLAEHRAFSEEDWLWMEELPVTIRLDENARGGPDDWVAVHAGFEPAFSWEKQRTEKMLRIRYVDEAGKMRPISSDKDQPSGTRQWAEVYPEPFHVVYGHMALSTEKPVFSRYEGTWLRGALDTACVFGGTLSALVLPLREGNPEASTVSVKAKRKYAEVWAGDE